MQTKTTEAIGLLNSIQKEIDKQKDALNVASEAMKKSHTKINETVHFIREMNDKPITQNERIILQKLYEVASILSDGSIDMRF